MDPLILAVVLYFVAVALAALDIFVPSGGILLIMSAIAAVGSILCGFRVGATSGLVVTTVVLATVPAFVYFAIKVWPHTPVGRRILLSPPNAAEVTPREDLNEHVGIVVVALWSLLPAGQIKVGRQHINARSADGRVIEAGQRVKVIGVQERVLIVSPTHEPLTELASEVSSGPKLADPGRPASDNELLETPVEQLGLDSLDELPLDRED